MFNRSTFVALAGNIPVCETNKSKVFCTSYVDLVIIQ